MTNNKKIPKIIESKTNKKNHFLKNNIDLVNENYII